MTQNIVIGGLAILLIAAAFVIWNLSMNKNKLDSLAKDQKSKIDTLNTQKKTFITRLDSLEDRSFRLMKEAEELERQRDMYLSQKDSVERLLAYSRTNERNSRAKIATLEKRLKDLQTKLEDVQSKYDELLASSGTSATELKARVEQLTEERNKLSSENQRLQQELAAATGNADNRTAIFTTSLSAIPGELRRDKFSASTRSQNMDRVEVSFVLSRPPKPTENLIFKVYDGTNKEIPIKPTYRNELNAPANPTNQKVILEFANGMLERSVRGNFSVRLFLTDVNKGLENQEIGLSEFAVK